jgi:peptidoglycan/LPS O-acetylase OafA/YrhL
LSWAGKTLPAPAIPAIEAAALSVEPSAAEPYDRRNRIAFADTCRTIAILAVVCDHLIRRLTESERLVKIADVFGILGVDCFFVLTGFLLARPYLEAVMGTRTFPSSRRFYARRFLRIWPLYAVAVLASALGERIHGGHAVHLGDVIAHLTMTHNFFPTYYLGKFNIPLWTMAVDADFYLLLPPIAFLGMLFARKLSPDNRIRFIFASCTAYFLGSLAFRGLIVVAFPRLVSDENLSFVFLRNVIGLGGSFSLGILIAACETARLRFSSAFTYRILGGAIAAAVVLFIATLTVGSADDGAFRAPILQASFDHVGALAAAGLLFSGLYGAERLGAKLGYAKPIVFLSTLSYSIYLFHAPILNAIFNVVGGRRRILHPSWKYGIELTLGTLIVTLIVAYVTNKFIERPFLRRKDALRELPVR